MFQAHDYSESQRCAGNLAPHPLFLRTMARAPARCATPRSGPAPASPHASGPSGCGARRHCLSRHILEKFMLKLSLMAAAMTFAVAGTAYSQTATQVPTSLSPGTNVVGVPGCHFGERIDGTTADDAVKFAQDAGYTSVTGLKKSCDNNWHGQAVLNGAPVNVMIRPDGRVVQEGS